MISTVSNPKTYFQQGLQISSSNPQVFPTGSPIQSTITFTHLIRIIQLSFIVTSPVVSFIARIGTNTTVLNSTVVALADGTYDYVIIVPPSLITPVTSVSVVITNTAPTNITEFAIQCCIGNSFISKGDTTCVLLIMFPAAFSSLK